MAKLSNKTAILISILMWTISHQCNYVESVGHCTEHRFNSTLISTNSMQFVKEVINHEYGLLDSLKGLHCCAKGYRSIEWYKDGKPYPWSSKDSSLILLPEAANQTIYTRRVELKDAGNYTCVLRNDTHKKTQHINFKVEENNPDLPLATFAPRDQYVQLDHAARFYCEAFVGKVSLPDARNEITWWHLLSNGHENEAEGKQTQISRENGQIVGSYLKIPNVQIYNYGRYVCRIQMGDASHKLELFAEINGGPIKANNDQTLLFGFIAAIIACALTLTIWFLIASHMAQNRKNNSHCQALMNNDLNHKYDMPRNV